MKKDEAFLETAIDDTNRRVDEFIAHIKASHGVELPKEKMMLIFLKGLRLKLEKDFAILEECGYKNYVKDCLEKISIGIKKYENTSS